MLYNDINVYPCETQAEHVVSLNSPINEHKHTGTLSCTMDTCDKQENLVCSNDHLHCCTF